MKWRQHVQAARIHLRPWLDVKPIHAEHILAIACTGHGASLAYLSRDTVRASVLDRFTGVKHTLLLAEQEEDELRHGDSAIDRAVRAALVHGFGRFPESRLFERTILEWTRWLLRGTGLGPEDMDLLVVSNCHFATNPWRLGSELGRWFPRARIRSHLEHHQMHQRQAFWQSGFEEAAVLTLDTCGEPLLRHWRRKLSGTLSRARCDGRWQVLEEHVFPRSSAGLYYDIATHHLGFSAQHGQGKTMGLAPYGGPELYDQVRHHLKLHSDGSFTFLSPDAFREMLQRYLPRRRPEDEILDRHRNIAHMVQALLERMVTHAFRTALRNTGLRDLVYAGGVALNSVANETARQEAEPRRFYVAPNPGDTGHALGSALWGAHELAGWPPPQRPLAEYLGPPYSEAEIEEAVRSSGLAWVRPGDLEGLVARCLADGCIVARFAGRAEHGPRALGNRSLLCDPRRPEMKGYLNDRVKHRESFRPFAPSVLLEQAEEWFELEGESPHMLRVVPVRENQKARIPAVTHVDGSARVQTVAREDNPGYHRLLSAFFETTSVPILLNTSFNVGGRPIVETPQQAIDCFASTSIDLLILDTFLLAKRPFEYLLTS